MQDDPFLHHFLAAQDAVWPRVQMELRVGRKQTHWMWFVFPQFIGLGSSAMAQRYAIHSLAEAQSYLAHDILGARLREATGLVYAVDGRSVHDIFGSPDDLKFHSCITLFAQVQSGDEVFKRVLAKYFNSQPDQVTLTKLAESAG